MTRSRALVVFHTGEGQSAGIAAAIATELCAHGIDADIWSAEVAPSPVGYDGVVAGDSIHASKHSRELRRYLLRHQAALAQRPLALFQVSLTSAVPDPQHTLNARAMVDDLVRQTGLVPDVVGMFPGRLAYTQYGGLQRRLMRWIARREGGDTDTSRDHEYTDWDAVRRFADDAAALIGQRAGVR
jgi:menaquinone-dependent protoporphyrinogen oxidase